MKNSISALLILLILGFLPIACNYDCNEFFLGKYDVELKESTEVSSGTYDYITTRITRGIEVDTVFNADYNFGCDVKTQETRVVSNYPIHISTTNSCYATSFITCFDSLTARFNIDSIHVFCDKIYNGVAALTSLDSNSVHFNFYLSGIGFNPNYYNSNSADKFKDFNNLVSILNSYNSYYISKVRSKKPTTNFEAVLRFDLRIKKPTDSNLTKFFIKIYLNNGTVLTTESRKIYWL